MSGNLNEDEVKKVFKELNDVPAKNELIDINLIFRFVVRYKWLIVAMTLAAVTAAYAFTSLIRPVYQSNTVFEIVQYNDSDVVGGRSGLGGRRNNFYNTQLSLLRGKRLATRVVEKLELYNNPEFTGELRQRTFSSIMRSVVRRGLNIFGLRNDSPAVPAQQQTPKNLDRDHIVNMLQSRVNVNLDRELFVVSVKSFNPNVAANIANAVVEAYRDIDREDKEAEKTRRNSTVQEALDDIEQRIVDQERKLAKFIRDNNVVDLDDDNNLETQKLNLLNSQYLQAQGTRIALESQYKFGSYDGTVDVNESKPNSEAEKARLEADFNLQVRDMRRQRVDLMGEIRNLKDIYKQDHPFVKEKLNELTELEKSIDVMLEERKKSLYRKYQAALDKEQTIKEALDRQKDLILSIQENSLEYNILKRELSGLKQLHAGMLERVKRTGIASELELSQVSIVDSARPNYGPVSPNMKKNVALAGTLGFLISLGMAGLLGYYDRRLRSPESLGDVSPYRNLSVVATLSPKELNKTKAPIELVSIADPGGGFAESFRSLRTSLMYSLPGGLPKTMMITSAAPGEGKTTTIVNLAFTLQRNEGKRILIIDLDLRKPRLHKVFSVPCDPGVTNYIMSPENEPQIYNVNELDSVKQYSQNASATLSNAQSRKSGLYMMTAGALTSSPVELLESESFKQLFDRLQQEFDCILIDSAPVMGLSDALILSSYADAVVMAVSAEKATRDSVRETVNKLESVNARVVGTVMTKFDMKSEGYAYSSKYNAYYYDYGKK